MPNITFFSTLRCGKRALSSTTNPKFLFSGGNRKFFFETTLSLIFISPSTTSSNPATILKRVVFPIPEGPRIETISPFFKRKIKIFNY
jgi:hypothetical protein